MKIITENWRPYYESSGPMKPEDNTGCPWFHLELNSHCNLGCTLCPAGNKDGYIFTKGQMPLEFVEKAFDKIATEHPHPSIRCYGYSEPFLYPWLPEIIISAKRRGFVFELSSNFNHMPRLEEVMAAGPSYLLVGFSGWNQDTYAKSHKGGDIEKVRANMIKVAGLRSKYPIRVLANYHVYTDNRGEEMEAAKTFITNCGFEWCPTPARAISIENTIAYLRHIDKANGLEVPPMGTCQNGFNWDEILPSVSANYLEQIQRLTFSPAWAKDFYKKWPVPEVCPLKDIGCFIRWDGKVTFCATQMDRRLDIGNYLDMTQQQMRDARAKDHPICKECLRYRYNLYCCLVDYDIWDWK